VCPITYDNTSLLTTGFNINVASPCGGGTAFSWTVHR
jgi:hypothetical protein